MNTHPLAPAPAAILVLAAGAAAQPLNDYRAPNVQGQFGVLKHHGEAMGYRTNGITQPTSWVDKNHIQGIVRTSGVGRPYLFVTQAGNADTGMAASITIVRMDSRDIDGERFRSNRLGVDYITDYTWPPYNDGAVARVDLNQAPINYAHAGSEALTDDVLVVPLEDNLSGSSSPGVAFFDVRNRESPQLIYTRTFSHAKAGTCAITRLDNGPYLLIIGGVDDGHTLVGYVSTTTDLRDPNLQFLESFSWHDTANDFGDPNYTWPIGVGPCLGKEAHQSYTFIRQTDGTLYLVGMSRRGSCGSPYGVGEDDADLFQVVFPSPSNGMRLVAVGGRHLYCSWDQAGFNGNFIAASCAYVSPSGSLVLYSLPHSNGQFPNSLDYVHMVEFRSYKVNQMGSTGPCEPYFELYNDSSGWGGNDRSLVYDWQDRGSEPWYNLGFHDDFNDKASSIIWCAPLGTSVVLYENNNLGGASVTLPGTGIPQYADLSTYGFSDRVTSVNVVGTLGTVVNVGPLHCGSSGCLQMGTSLYPIPTVNGGLAVMQGSANTLNILGGTYSEHVTFAKPMTITSTTGGAVIIGTR